MKPYSQDIRKDILEALDRGMPREKVVRIFGVSLATIKLYIKQRRENGEIAPRAISGCPSKKLRPLQARLQLHLEAYPNATLEEHCEHWEADARVKASISTMSRAIQRLGWTQRKL